MNFSRTVLAVLLATGFLVFPALAQTDTARTPAEICESAGIPESTDAASFDAPEAVLEPDTDYRAILCTDAGAVYIDLFEDLTPLTVNSFVFLAQEGFYDNTTFHRVLEDFMAQGGDPTATGTGGPGYQFADEFVPFLTFDEPGWLAMANAGPGTNGSQFFITTAATSWLDYRHTIFGVVLEGQDVVDSIELRDPDTATGPGTALNSVIIITDSDSVESTHESPTGASEGEIEEALEAIASAIPEGIIEIDADESGIFTTEQVVASAPANTQADMEAYLERHGHQYRAASRLIVPSCGGEQEPFFAVIAYALDVYASPADAAAALADSDLEMLTLASGFTDSSVPEGSATPVYTIETEACGTEDGVQALIHWQRGRYVVTAQATLPSGLPADTDVILTNYVGGQIYEQLLADVLRKEIR